VAKKGLFWLLIGLYAVGRFLFPPLEFTGDSYGYACELLKGELWNSHHILHKYFINDLWLILKPLHLFQNPLLFYSSLHLIIALSCIYVLQRILEYRHWSQSRIYLALLFVISGFAFTKYNIENEVYFYPILLSLIGSYQFEKNQKYTAAIWLGLACLFHQIHIFWLLGLLFPRDWKKPSNYYPLGFGLAIPIVTYTTIGLITNETLISLLFHDVQAGLVQTIPNINNTLLFFVNIVRTLFQVHGDILLFWNLWNPYYSGIAVLIFIFILLGFVIYLRERRFSYQKSDWYFSYSVAFILHLAFAWYSVGNIEFMVVLPILLVLTLRNGSLLKHSMLLGVGLILWNTTQWFIPMAKTRPNRIKDQIEIATRIVEDEFHDNSNSHKIKVFTQNAALVQNTYEYMKLSKLMASNDTITKHPNIEFIDYHKDSLESGYLLTFSHVRMNRMKLSFSTTEGIPKDSMTSLTRLYRDTGINGLLEFYRVELRKEDPTNSDR